MDFKRLALRLVVFSTLIQLVQANLSAQIDSPACDSYPSIEYGSDRPVIDSIGSLLSIPKKLLLWDRRVDSHDVGHATVSQVHNYLIYRDMGDAKIRVNQYDPLGEWDRLVANKRVHPGWKYTAGVLKHLKYTFVPGRLFGGDEYNPFTDTVSVYSDVPAMGLAEAAYGYDIRQREYPGTYATAQMLPIVALWHETKATDEVITYIALRGSDSQLREARHDLYARYGLSIGGEVAGFLPDGSPVFEIAGALTGHTLAFVENR